MALRPDTPETRLVPVAGRGNFAERRLMRGVGSKERALGYAWGRLDSKQRASFGNQRNYASRLQDVADAQAEQRTAQTNQQALEKGRQMAREEAGGGMPAAGPGIPTGPVKIEGSGQDRPDGLIKYDDNKPKVKPARVTGPAALKSAIEGGRIKMGSYSGPSHADSVLKEQQGNLFRTARLRGQFNTATGGRIY